MRISYATVRCLSLLWVVGSQHSLMMMGWCTMGGMYAVLDPTLKLAYVKTHWDTEYYEHAEATIERVVRLSRLILPSSTCA